jgi:hypothetical protein
MMTSFAFILGVVPLMVSTGAGAEMRQTLGTAVFSGMLGVTLFGIFLTPVFYFVIQWASDKRVEYLKRTTPTESDRPTRERGLHDTESGNGHAGPDHGTRDFNGNGDSREQEDLVTTAP